MNDFRDNPFGAWTPPRTQAQDLLAQDRQRAQGGGGLPAGMRDSGAYWREVQGNELAGNRLTQGLAAGGAFLTGARARGQRFAQARRAAGWHAR